MRFILILIGFQLALLAFEWVLPPGEGNGGLQY